MYVLGFRILGNLPPSIAVNTPKVPDRKLTDCYPLATIAANIAPTIVLDCILAAVTAVISLYSSHYFDTPRLFLQFYLPAPSGWLKSGSSRRSRDGRGAEPSQHGLHQRQRCQGLNLAACLTA